MNERVNDGDSLMKDYVVIDNNVAESVPKFSDKSGNIIQGVDLEGMEDPFENDWETIERKHHLNSPYSGFETYRLMILIFKSNDDLRQELLAM